MATVRVFNLRASPSGGGLVGDPIFPQFRSPRITILMHGYNDPVMDAREAYFSFFRPGEDPTSTRDLPPYAWQAFIERLAGDTLDAVAGLGEVCLFFWPGDPAGRGVSAPFYADALRNGITSGVFLGTMLDWLLSQFGSLEATLICHSLGNRVALEAINFLLDKYGEMPRSARFRMCLMAAAVPVPRVEPGEDLNLAAAALSARLVLFSGGDSILGTWFPQFETLAQDGDFPEAVGHAGNPAGVWGPYRANMAGYGHSDYWPGTDSRSQVLRFLGTTTAAPPATNAIASNAPPPNAAISARTVYKRPLGSRALRT